jgi:sigma-54 dependent transcriptional regulator, acetoin dehydrogenase operon transcriptional activator AcoR
MSSTYNKQDAMQRGVAASDPRWTMEDQGYLPPYPGDNMTAVPPPYPGDRRITPPEPGNSGVLVSDLITESHRRSRTYGLDIDLEPDFSRASRGHMGTALEENRFLFQHAAPVMETLYDQIINTHSMVALTSAKGMVLHSLGDADFLEKATRVALMPGADWSEMSKGTNAVGTALAEAEALTVHGSQHFLSANQFLTCSCAPIFDPYGQVIGALDVTGDQRSFHHHTLALVRMSAQMIENHMFADIFHKAVRIHFHARSEFLGTLVEGIAVFSPEGRFQSANRSAQFQLGLPFSALGAHTFSSLFGMPMSALLDLFRGSVPKPHQLVLHNGVAVWCRANFQVAPTWSNPLVLHTTDTRASPPQQPPRRVDTAVGKPHFSALQYLDTGDPQVSMVLQKLIKVSGRDIPVMIQGETGTGKDLLAKAIHADSSRAGHAFVSVNCASIPDTLIESELFGYEEGAFTGARKKGSTGKILQAHSGTLFLDEIGDMPKHLQARLLRMLQERKISPLGAGKEVDVDVAVISATHKNLKDMITRGEFREDLYYRLNGLVVKLPALRERIDFDVVTRKILSTLCDTGQQIRVSEPVMDMFRRYPWPGNIRQLHNLLRTAVAMVGCEGEIRPEHLPDDFVDELSPTRSGSGATLSHLAIPVEPASSDLDASPPGSAHLPSETTADPRQRLHDVALAAMAQMLRLHNGNVSAAAKALGVSRNTIYRKKDLLPPDLLR